MEGEAAGEHGLARPGRAHHEQPVASRRRDRHRPLGQLLVGHVPEVGRVAAAAPPPGLMADERLQGRGPVPQLREPADAEDPLRPAADERACRRDHQTKPVRAGEQRVGHVAADRTDRPVEPELANEEQPAGHLGRKLRGGDEDGDGDRQVIGRPRLPQLARGQVDRDVLPGQPKAARLEGAAHPRPRLEDRRVRHPHDVEPRQPVREAHLHLHDVRLDPVQRRRAHDRGPRPHHSSAPKAFLTWCRWAVPSSSTVIDMTSKRTSRAQSISRRRTTAASR